MTSACVACGSNETKVALPLRKEDGLWVVKPVCEQCRQALQRQAREAGKSIAFYGLEGSMKEAEKRNAEKAKFSPLLEAFARARKSVSKNGSKPHTARV